MTRNKKLLLGGVAVAVLGLGAAGAMARHGGPHGWGHGKHHGGMFGFGPGPMGKVCRDGRTAEMADVLAVRIENRAKPTDAQRASFDELKTALKSGAEKIKAGCPASASAAEPAKDGEPRKRLSPVERLANMEAMTAATLDAIKTVRPAAEKFYAQLSDEQKASLTPERKGRWWRHREGRGDGDGPGRGRGGDRGEDGPDMP